MTDPFNTAPRPAGRGLSEPPETTDPRKLAAKIPRNGQSPRAQGTTTPVCNSCGTAHPIGYGARAPRWQCPPDTPRGSTGKPQSPRDLAARIPRR